MSLSEQLDAVRTERARQFKRARVDDDGPGAGRVGRVGGGGSSVGAAAAVEAEIRHNKLNI